MITYSHKQTIRLVNGVTDDYDNDVLEWGESFVEGLKVWLIDNLTNLSGIKVELFSYTIE